MARPKGPSFGVQELVLRTIDLHGPICFNMLVASTKCNRNAVSYSLKFLREIGAVERRREGKMVLYETSVYGIACWMAYQLWKREKHIVRACRVARQSVSRYEDVRQFGKRTAKLVRKYDSILEELHLYKEKVPDKLWVAEDLYLARQAKRSIKERRPYGYPNEVRNLVTEANQIGKKLRADWKKGDLRLAFMLEFMDRMLPENLKQRLAANGPTAEVFKSILEWATAYIEKRASLREYLPSHYDAVLLLQMLGVEFLLNKRGPGILRRVKPPMVRLFCLWQLYLIIDRPRRRRSRRDPSRSSDPKQA